MAAYCVAIGNIHDQERFDLYMEAVGPTLIAHGGDLLGIEDPAEVMEGDAPFPRVVLVKFPDKEAARNWYASPEYQAIIEHRLAAADSVLYLLDEFVMPAE